jgi:hypothetical protein
MIMKGFPFLFLSQNVLWFLRFLAYLEKIIYRSGDSSTIAIRGEVVLEVARREGAWISPARHVC